MRHVIFLVTELYRPVGGLHRYTSNLLTAWKTSKGRKYDPIVLSIKPRGTPLEDLKPSKIFAPFCKENPGVKVYEAERGGVMCYFLDAEVPDMNFFHYELWEKFRIRSEKTSALWLYYNENLCPFWYWVPKASEFLSKRFDIACIDAQDWLAFPAGFLAKKAIDRPLVCRFHSGEFGRSLGHPDTDSAPVLVEAAALMEADYIQGVSINETIFEVTSLLPLKKRLTAEMRESKGESWYALQKLKEMKLEEFLIYEPEKELVLLKDFIGALPNGIELDEWKSVKKKDIMSGKKAYGEMLPGKKRFVFFLGRAEYRKGLDFLLESFAVLKKRKGFEDAGLIISSKLEGRQNEFYKSKLRSYELEDSVAILDRWVGKGEKRNLLCAADVIALPSVYEPFGIVALEGLAADLACEKNRMPGPVVVVGNTGGMDEIITSGIDGFEIPIRNFSINTAMFTEILSKALSGGKLRESISRNGAERVKSEYFSWSFIVKRVFELYSKAEANFGMSEKFESP